MVTNLLKMETVTHTQQANDKAVTTLKRQRESTSYKRLLKFWDHEWAGNTTLWKALVRTKGRVRDMLHGLRVAELWAPPVPTCLLTHLLLQSSFNWPIDVTIFSFLPLKLGSWAPMFEPAMKMSHIPDDMVKEDGFSATLDTLTSWITKSC